MMLKSNSPIPARFFGSPNLGSPLKLPSHLAKLSKAYSDGSYKASYEEHRTVIMAHRGGNFGPENSMMNFRKALENKCEGIEFDVWLSKDGVPMVLHGGNDGQLTLYGMPTEHVFNWTSERLRSEIDIGQGEVMPTLRELIELFKDSPALLNIELKGPLAEDIKAGYDYPLACFKVRELIREFNLERERVLVSSFVPEIIANMDKLNTDDEFLLHTLKNFDNLPEKNGLAGMICPDSMQGINVSACHLTEEMIYENHEQGKKVGVWIMAKDLKETESFWEDMVLKEVDLFYTDFPLEAQRVRDDLKKPSRKESGFSSTSTGADTEKWSFNLDQSFTSSYAE